MSQTVQKLEEARDALLAVLGPRDGRLHRVLALLESALDDFWRPGDEEVPAALVEEETVYIGKEPPRPRAG
jgi:hypothetical protein